MPESEKVPLTHAGVAGVYMADPEAVPGWEELGWTKKTPKSSKSSGKESTDG